MLPKDQAWPPQGQWTYDDFLRLPDDGVRYEVIQGVLYMTNAPDPEHQYAVVKITTTLDVFVSAHQAGVVYAAPIEVHLPGIAQPVQPDICFIRQERRSIVGRKFIEGVPDLMVEVLSPSTARTDRRVKFDAYERAGAREYWIANPKTRTVEVYTLTPEGYDLHGEFGPGEYVTSPVLPDLKFLAESVFSQP